MTSSGGGPWSPVWKPTTLINGLNLKVVLPLSSTWLQSADYISSQLIKGWSQEGVPPPAATVSHCRWGRWSLAFFWLLSFTSPHTDLSPPSFASCRVCLAPRWCFFISSCLMSCSPSICEGLSSFSAAATCCKLFLLIVKSHKSVMAAGEVDVGGKDEGKRGKHTRAKN